MDDWQKLIQVLVEIWTDEDIKNGKWIKACEEFITDEPSEQEFPNEAEI